MTRHTRPYKPLGFRKAKRRTLEALANGDIQHEPREARQEKNLLAVGEVTVAFVAALIRGCAGAQYTSSSHHLDSRVEVHLFLPGHGQRDRDTWYVKLYFRNGTTFISVHR